MTDDSQDGDILQQKFGFPTKHDWRLPIHLDPEFDHSPSNVADALEKTFVQNDPPRRYALYWSTRLTLENMPEEEREKFEKELGKFVFHHNAFKLLIEHFLKVGWVFDAQWIAILGKFQPCLQWVKTFCASAIGYHILLLLKDRLTYESHDAFKTAMTLKLWNIFLEFPTSALKAVVRKLEINEMLVQTLEKDAKFSANLVRIYCQHFIGRERRDVSLCKNIKRLIVDPKVKSLISPMLARRLFEYGKHWAEYAQESIASIITRGWVEDRNKRMARLKKEWKDLCCGYCGKKHYQVKKLKGCGRCKGDVYCGSKCEGGDWEKHEEICNVLHHLRLREADLFKEKETEHAWAQWNEQHQCMNYGSERNLSCDIVWKTIWERKIFNEL